jgi:SprB repeat/CHU_C Type IX secretion signal domain/PKD domain
MLHRILCAATLLFIAISGFAQAPANDECSSPIRITNVKSFCSNTAAYTNVGATPSSYGPAGCFGSTTQRDVWFSFVAEATDVQVAVRGAAAGSPGGTLRNPQVAIYAGTCGGTINELECQTARNNTHIVEAYQGGLFIGTTYLIRVQAPSNGTGTFQLCVNNYNPPAELSSDCPTASILCDKSPFVVRSVTGAGRDTREMNDASCFSGGSPTNFESNSTWFVWRVSQAGNLTFTLTPLNPLDDLDFVLYRLPNGIGNCGGKQLVRCMASGESQGQNSDRCLGPTGLRVGASGTSMPSGCPTAASNAWLSPVNMSVGEVYALVVNNFSNTGNGFSIDFGGSVQFQGPEAKFTTKPEAVCPGIPIVFEDASTFALGSITKWEWSFGPDATPQTATGKGPHTVTFRDQGTRSVALTVETNLGCRVTDIQTIKIFGNVKLDTLIAEPDCNGTTNGRIAVSNVREGTAPYQFSWRGGPFSTDNTLSNLGPGTYSLVVRDANGCTSSLSIPVLERQLRGTATAVAPKCNGGNNGTINLNITNGVGPFRFQVGSGAPQVGTVFNNISAGSYTITGSDAVLCKGSFTVTVTEPMRLEARVEGRNISCSGLRDGRVNVTPTGGTAPYRYQWANNRTDKDLIDLAAGTYSVTITDANDCTVTGSATIIEPRTVAIRLVGTKNLACNGIAQGEIRVEGVGGTTPYTFSTDGRTFGNTSTITGLAAGTYTIRIRDGGGCRDSVVTTLTQPAPIRVDVSPPDTLINLGSFMNPRVTTVATSALQYKWSPEQGLSCTNCANPRLQGVGEQKYILKITDASGCMAFDSILITINPIKPVYAPNAFMPESSREGGNDRFTLYGGLGSEQVRVLRIFDRWGALVFEQQDFPLNQPNLGWDGMVRGKPAAGVFAFYAVVRFLDQSEEVIEGNITVVR